MPPARADLFVAWQQECEWYADWRWTTLPNVTGDLARMQDVLINATATLTTSDLASRDGVVAQTFLSTVQSPLFWRQCQALHALAKPVSDFSG